MPVPPEVDQAISNGQVRLAPGPESHRGLANAIVKAWRDPTYRDRLLTFPASSTADISPRDYERTKQALTDEGVNLPNPVVLTADQFAQLVQREAFDKHGPYKGIRPTDVVLVLPEPIGQKTPQDAHASMLVRSMGV
jgi:hypothetical protein